MRFFALAFLLLVYSPAGKVYIFDDSKGLTVEPYGNGFKVSDREKKVLGFFTNGWAWTRSDFKPIGEENWKVGQILK